MDEKIPEATQSREAAVVASPPIQASRETPKAPKLEEIRRKSAETSISSYIRVRDTERLSIVFDVQSGWRVVKSG